MDAVNLFIAVSSQWRVGFNGPTGLDYTALAAAMDLMSVPTSRRGELFEEVRIMEDAALGQMAEERAKK